MDQFVTDQLNLIGCQHLIPLFRDNGYNEDAYRQLGMRELLELFPDDNDEDLAMTILCNVNSLPASGSANGFRAEIAEAYPRTNVVVKTEPSSGMSTPGPSHAHGGRGRQEEVQNAGNATNEASGTSGPAHAEIKQETDEVEDEDSDPGEADAGHEPDQAADSSDEVDIAENIEMDSADEMREESDPEDDDNCPTDDRVEPDDNQRSLRPRKKLRYSYKPCKRTPKVSQIRVGTFPSWRRLNSILQQTQTGNSLPDPDAIELCNCIDDSLVFVCDTLTHLDRVLELLERFGGTLGQVVKTVHFVFTAIKNVISAPQVARLASLPETFLSQLTSLEFHLGFPDNTDFALVTTLLAKCVNMAIFNLTRAEFLTGTEVKLLRIPKMDSLVSFMYGGAGLRLSTTDFLEPASIVDVEADTFERNNPVMHLEIDFGNSAYPSLEVLIVGPKVAVNFASFTQFPRLDWFSPKHASTLRRILTRTNDAAGEKVLSVKTLYLSSGESTELVQLIKFAFPNITELGLGVITVPTLSTVIRTMADMQIKKLSFFVGYEFESALLTALRGLPFKLVTEKDKLKLNIAKKYKHWAGLLKYLSIEVPEEELHDHHNSNSNENAESGNTCTIGSFKHLKWLRIVSLKRFVRLPENDLHWTNPDVKLSPKQWTSGKHRFPPAILLEELTKLKGHLKYVHLEGFLVDNDVVAQFERIMGFKPRFHDIPNENGDCFSDKDLERGQAQQIVKQENFS